MRGNFFNQATLKICGSLEIEKALHECLLYIREFIPTTAQMGFHVFHRDEGVIETVPYADPEVGKSVSVVTKLDKNEVGRQKWKPNIFSSFVSERLLLMEADSGSSCTFNVATSKVMVSCQLPN